MRAMRREVWLSRSNRFDVAAVHLTGGILVVHAKKCQAPARHRRVTRQNLYRLQPDALLVIDFWGAVVR